MSNHALTASFITKGAELQSLIDQNTATNYLWIGPEARVFSATDNMSLTSATVPVNPPFDS